MDFANLGVVAYETVTALEVSMPEPLTQADLVVLREDVRRKDGGALQRLKERHHALARLLASGTAPKAAAIITGYNQCTVYQLMDDPTFCGLMDFYREQVADEYQGMHAQMAGLGADAVDEVRRRIEEEPEKIGFGALLDVIKTTADRTGYGPSSKTETTVNVNVGIAEKMAAARKRASAALTEIEVAARDITPKGNAA